MKKYLAILLIILLVWAPLLSYASPNFIGVRLDKTSNLFSIGYEKPDKTGIGTTLNTDYRVGYIKGRIAARHHGKSAGWFLITSVYLGTSIATRSIPMAAGTIMIPFFSLLFKVNGPSPDDLLKFESRNDDFRRGFIKGYHHKVRSERVNGCITAVLFAGFALFAGHLILVSE